MYDCIWNSCSRTELLLYVYVLLLRNAFVILVLRHGVTEMYSFFFFFLKIFGGHKSFSWGHWYLYFGLLAMSPLGFKARVDPSLVCFVACMQWIPDIHLWCDTCWLYRGQHGSWAFSIHKLQTCLQALVEVQGSNLWPSVQQARCCRPLGHYGLKCFLVTDHSWVEYVEQDPRQWCKGGCWGWCSYLKITN